MFTFQLRRRENLFGSPGLEIFEMRVEYNMNQPYLRYIDMKHNLYRHKALKEKKVLVTDM